MRKSLFILLGSLLLNFSVAFAAPIFGNGTIHLDCNISTQNQRINETAKKSIEFSTYERMQILVKKDVATTDDSLYTLVSTASGISLLKMNLVSGDLKLSIPLNANDHSVVLNDLETGTAINCH